MSDDDDWEYYDDTTTLTDLWQHLKDECLEDDPLGFWLKTPIKDVQDAIFDFWRLKVPLVLAPGYGHTSLDQPISQEVVKTSLIQPLESYICGGPNTREIFESLSANDSPPSVCGKPIQPGLAVYGCRDCGQDATCVMCAECFNESEHKNHNYRMSTTDGNGFCDCGDPEAFLQHHLCRTHEEASKNEVSAKDVLASFPEDLRNRTRQLFRVILQYIVTMTATRKSKFEDWKVGAKEKETWPDLDYPFTHSTHCCLLMNDDSHSYQQVTTIIKMVLKCPEKKAMDLTELVDKVGRAVITVGSYKDCVKAREQVERKSDRDTRPLRVLILPVYLVSHQIFALKLCSWLMTLFSKSSGFRALFFEVLCMEDSTIDDENQTFLVKLLTKSSITWKAVRRAWIELIVEVAMKNHENKMILSKYFLENYKVIMYDFMSDDQEPDVSIATLSVQIFTVPSVSQHLIESHDALTQLVTFFLQIFEDEAKYDDNGQLDLTDWLDERQHDYTRCVHVLSDIQYLLSAEPTQWTTKMRKNFIQGSKALIDLIGKLQHADPQARATEAHIEHESRNWYCVFNIASQLMQIAHYVKLWCRSDSAVLKPITNYLLGKIGNEFSQSHDRKELKLGQESYSVISFDVLHKPCSIHIPLNQFLAMLLTCFNQENEDILQMIQSHADPLELVSPVLTVLAVLAQVKCGMWRRNGMYGEGQHYFYNDPKIAPHNKINDLMLLQAICSVIPDPGTVVVSMMDRLNLIDWLLMSKEELPEETFDLADEFLSLVIAISSEKINTDISEIPTKEELKHRLIHLLVSGELSHSEVLKHISKDCSKTEVQVEEILHEIADLVTSKKDTSKRIYQLKKSYVKGINPFFYFYTRSQRDEVDSATFGEDIFNQPPNDMWPKTKPLFRGLPRLLWSQPLMLVIKNVLKRWQNEEKKSSHLVKHLHKVLFIINLGLDLNNAKFKSALEAENYKLLSELTQPPPELKELLSHTIDKANSALGATATALGVTSDSKPANTNENDRKRRAQAAAERKAKVMAQMSQMQKKFAKSHQSELDQIKGSNPQRMQESDQEDKSVKAGLSYRALGANQSLPSCTDDHKHTCILCQEEDSDPLVFATYIVNSTVLSRVEPIDPNLTGKCVSVGVLPSNLRCGPSVTSCGHVMHAKCYRTMFDNLVKQQQDEIVRSNFNVSRQEYLCPICQRLSNCVLPIAPHLSTHLVTKSSSRKAFALWFADMTQMLESKVDVKKKNKIADECEEMANFQLNDPIDFRPLISSPFSSEFGSMTTNFASNCVLKSLKELDDRRSLNIGYQTAAMNLHLSQTSEEDLRQLFVPLVARDSQVLQALVRFCLNMPFAQGSLKETVQSSGLYVLAVLMKPSLLTYSNTNLLDLDLLHVLIIMTASMPLLFKDASVGSFDHHVMRFCAILHLIQIVAGLRSQSEEIQGQDPNEADVHKLAKWVSQVVGTADRVTPKANLVQRAMIKFLRCSALFFHFVTNVPLPVLEGDHLDDHTIYSVLSQYLSLPPTLSELINQPDNYEIMDRVLQNDRMKLAVGPELSPKLRKLIDLPQDYTDLLNMATTYECPTTSSLERKTKSVAICLLCGRLICCESYCCKGEIDGLKAGGCTIHARKCNADLGLFIKLSSCQLVILSGVSKGGFFPAPYVDRFGEHDEELLRGNQLKLDQNQYDKLNKMFQQNDLQTYIAKTQRSRRSPLSLQWFLF